MKNSLRVYIDGLFEQTPKIEPVVELHDEILSNLEARYDDCIAGGMTPQRAYTAVISTMGDIGTLIEQVSGTGFHEDGVFEKFSPKSRLFEKYSYVFTEENIKEIKGAAHGILWIMIVIAYFGLSFITGKWAYSWLVFIVGAGISVGLNMVSKISKISKHGDNPESRVELYKTLSGGMSGILWLAIVVIYFLFSFVSGLWGISWVLFLVATIIQIVMSTVFKIQINRYKSYID